MKLKMTLLFLILSAIFVYFVFKGSYFSFNKSAETAGIKDSLTYEAILNKFYASNLKDYQGSKISITNEALKGRQMVIIHLWASWCGPCVNEVPELIAYSNKNPDIKFVIISLDQNQDDIAKFLKSFPEFNSDRYIKIWDDSSVLSKFLDADRLPMSFILRKGKSEPQIVKSVVDWKTLKL